MKYIVVEGICCGDAIIFSEVLTHAEVAGSRKVLGAGFVFFEIDSDGEVNPSCYGESETLGIKCRGEDNFAIRIMLKYQEKNNEL